MNAPANWLAAAEARDRDIAKLIRSQPHPCDCLCISCAPISTPTRSPMIDDALAGNHGVEVAQGVESLIRLMPYGRKVAAGHLKALEGLQRKLG
jgi:hypothetical protein